MSHQSVSRSQRRLHHQRQRLRAPCDGGHRLGRRLRLRHPLRLLRGGLRHVLHHHRRRQRPRLRRPAPIGAAVGGRRSGASLGKYAFDGGALTPTPAAATLGAALRGRCSGASSGAATPVGAASSTATANSSGAGLASRAPIATVGAVGASRRRGVARGTVVSVGGFGNLAEGVFNASPCTTARVGDRGGATVNAANTSTAPRLSIASAVAPIIPALAKVAVQIFFACTCIRRREQRRQGCAQLRDYVGRHPAGAGQPIRVAALLRAARNCAWLQVPGWHPAAYRTMAAQRILSSALALSPA